MGKYDLVTNSDMYDCGNQTKNVQFQTQKWFYMKISIQKIPCSHKSVLINLITR